MISTTIQSKDSATAGFRAGAPTSGRSFGIPVLRRLWQMPPAHRLRRTTRCGASPPRLTRPMMLETSGCRAAAATSNAVRRPVPVAATTLVTGFWGRNTPMILPLTTLRIRRTMLRIQRTMRKNQRTTPRPQRTTLRAPPIKPDRTPPKPLRQRPTSSRSAIRTA